MERQPQGPTLPRTVRQLRLWLRWTKEGRKLLADLTVDLLEEKCRKCQTDIKPRPKVLVVARRLGQQPGVEVYAERGVAVRLEELFDTEDNQIMEIAADEALAIRVPKSWQYLLRGVEPQQPTRSIVFTGLPLARYVEFLGLENTIRELKEIG